MMASLLNRTLLSLNALHDRNPVAIQLTDGSIRNAYTLHLLNKRDVDRTVAIDIDGPPNAKVLIIGADSITKDRPMIILGRDSSTELRVLVTTPTMPNQKSTPVRFIVTDLGFGEIAEVTDNFVTP